MSDKYVFCVFVNVVAATWKTERFMVVICWWWISENIWSKTAVVVCRHGIRRPIFWCCQRAEV